VPRGAGARAAVRPGQGDRGDGRVGGRHRRGGRRRGVDHHRGHVMAAPDLCGADERGPAIRSTSKEMDRPRPGANQYGAGSPATQPGQGEVTSMTQDGIGPLAGRQLTYWVAYSHASGLGAVAVSTAARLNTPGQLVGLAEQISRDAGNRDVVVLSWHLMSASTEAAAPTAVERATPADVVGPVDVPVSAPQGAAVRAE